MKNILSISIVILLNSCYIYHPYETKSHDNRPISIQGKSANVCKELKGSTILYLIYVNDKSSKHWNNFDLEQSKNAIAKAEKWINKEANKNDVSLNLKVVHHSAEDSIKPIVANLTYKSVNHHLFYAEKGIEKIHKWSNKISKHVNSDLRKIHQNIPKEIKGRDDLIYNLRKIYKTDNIALMFVLNNPIREESSVTFHNQNTFSNNNSSEYTIISQSKKPAVFAHEFLHLFGAMDFYNVNYQHIKIDKKLRKKYGRKHASVGAGSNNKTYILREHPNAIMKNINLEVLDSLEITPITQYLIGWKTKEKVSIKDKELMLFGDYIVLD